MTASGSRRRWHGSGRLVAFALACLLAASVIHGARGSAPRVTSDSTELYLSGPVLQRLALSYDALLADVYWIRALQHFGGTRRSDAADKRFDRLYPLLDVVTTLDPAFNIAYRFGAIFLAEPPPGGPGRPDQAIALLRKGLAADPERWQYMQDIGFIHYWWLQDYQAAADWFLRASRVPGSSWWLETLAANTLAEGGDREASRFLWQQVAVDGDNDWLRQEARRRLAQLAALDAIDQLTPIVEEHAQRSGRFPASWTPLVAAGLLADVPLDPVGQPFELDRVGRRVVLAADSPLRPLPGEYMAAAP